MAIIYTNRKGKIYYLIEGKTSKGNPKYYFSPKNGGNILENIPEGYEIYENPINAELYLRKAKEKIFTDEEFTIVKEELSKYIKFFIIDSDDNHLTIYEPETNIHGILESFGKNIGGMLGFESECLSAMKDVLKGYYETAMKRKEEEVMVSLSKVSTYSPVIKIGKEENKYYTLKYNSNYDYWDFPEIEEDDLRKISKKLGKYLHDKKKGF